MEIKVLSRQGASIREISRQLGCSRNTVRRHLRGEQTGQYGPRAPRPTKLDPYKTYLRERVQAAYPKRIPSTVLLREIREQGYPGAGTQLKEFLRAEWPGKPPEPENRFETAPGKQMQADFTHIRRGRSPLLAFVATLGYSRASWVHFTTNERATTLGQCLESALQYFGGVPEHVLFDNAGTIVIERDAYGPGNHRWHQQILALSDRYGFSARLCRPYRARTKGKVERFNGYLKRSFCVPLAASLKQAGLYFDEVAANAHIGPWLTDVANCRIHGTTGERPDVRLVVERQHLIALPDAIAVRHQSGLTSDSGVIPIESLQHPLSVYDALLGEPA